MIATRSGVIGLTRQNKLRPLRLNEGGTERKLAPRKTSAKRLAVASLLANAFGVSFIVWLDLPLTRVWGVETCSLSAEYNILVASMRAWNISEPIMGKLMPLGVEQVDRSWSGAKAGGTLLVRRQVSA